MKKCDVKYLVTHIQYEPTAVLVFGILIVPVDHSTGLFPKLIMQSILYCLIAHLCN